MGPPRLTRSGAGAVARRAPRGASPPYTRLRRVTPQLVHLDGGVVVTLEALARALLLGAEVDRVGAGGVRSPAERAAAAMEAGDLVEAHPALPGDPQLDGRELRQREADPRRLADGGRGGARDLDLRRVDLVAAVLLGVRAEDVAEVADARVVHDLPQQLVVVLVRDLAAV